MCTRARFRWCEQALETAALMLGSDKSRGYCLEMICADFLAGANLDTGNPDIDRSWNVLTAPELLQSFELVHGLEHN
ncbi:MAG: hypothetical protein DMG69_05815 [Acidobacteria bacterium]|nr:MAG: hypothetical protein DMG69_05815 [Acidobacteriota bacterium]